LYMINAIFCIGNDETEFLISYSSYIKKISESIHNTFRNITCSLFTSVSFFDNMQKFSFTMVGSLQWNNPDVPQMFKRALAKGTYQCLLMRIIKH